MRRLSKRPPDKARRPARGPRALFGAALLALGLPAGAARAQSNGGFQLNRYEPTAAGELSLLVDHPWYSSRRYLAAGFTLNYGHNPLLFGKSDNSGALIGRGAVIEHQLLGHLDIAGSFLDRALVTFSMPITLTETGTPQDGITPLGGGAVGDLRLGAMGRLYGQPYKGPVSIHVGLDLWIPINSYTGTFPPQVGETGFRVRPKLVLGGLTHSVLWSFMAAFYHRPVQTIGDLRPGFAIGMGPEIQAGAALGYHHPGLGLTAALEALGSTVVSGGNAFLNNYTSLEVLAGLHYDVEGLVQLSAGGGVGFFREAGTPDGRFLFRAAYAPVRDRPPRHPDADRDGFEDKDDECPQEAAGPRRDPRRPGCPLPDEKLLAAKAAAARAEARGKLLTVVRGGLKSPDPSLRLRALPGAATEPTLAEALRQRLEDGAPAVQVQAARILGERGAAEAAPALQQLLRPGVDAAVQIAAAEALAQLGDAAGVKRLREALRGKDAATALRAAVALAALGDRGAQKQLAATLPQPGAVPEDLYIAALGQLARQKDAKALEGLRERLASDEAPPEVRLAAGRELARAGDGPGLGQLQKMLAEAGPPRLVAAIILGEAGDAGGCRALVPLLGNRQAELPQRVWAAEALGRCSEKAQVTALSAMVAAKDTPEELRVAGASSLLALDGGGAASGGVAAAALAVLRRGLESGAPALQVQAARLAGQRGIGQVLPALARLLDKGRDRQVALSAAEALAQLGDPQGLRILHETYEAKDAVARVRAAVALAALGDKEIQRELPALVQTPGSVPVELLIAALGQVARGGDAVAKEKLRSRVGASWLAAEVRLAAARELVRIGDGPGMEQLQRMRSGDGPAQALAAQALGEGGDAAACRTLGELAASAKAPPPQRARAVEALARCAEAADRQQLAKLLDAKAAPEELRIAAAATLLALGSPAQSLPQTPEAPEAPAVKQPTLGDKAVAVLRKALESGSVPVQRDAARILGEQGIKAAVPDLMALVSRTNDSSLFLAVAEAMDRLGDSKILSILARNGSARANEILAERGDKKALGRLRKARTAKDGETRLRAVFALTRLGDNKAAKQLTKLAANPAGISPELQTRLLAYYAKGGDAGARRQLEQLMASGPEPMAAAKVLLELGDGGACRAIATAFQRGPDAGRGQAAEGLGRCKEAADAPALTAALEAPTSPEGLRVGAAAAVLALGIGGAPTGLAVGEGPAVAAAPAPTAPAAQAVGGGVKDRALAVVKKGLESASPAVQQVAARLAGRYGMKQVSLELNALLKRTTDVTAFVVTAEAASMLGDNEGAKALKDAKKAKDALVKLRSTVALAGQGSKKDQKQMGKMLGNGAGVPEEVYAAALGYQARDGDRGARGKLEQMMAGGAGQAAAAAVLAELGDANACRVLGEVFKGGSGALRVQAAGGLGRCAATADVAALAQVMEAPDSPEELRVAAAAALLSLAK